MPLNFVAKAAITIAMTAANMALTMSRKIEGPRLDDLKVTGADYGTSLYRVWGMRRLEVPIFHAEDMKEVKRRRKTKGGKYNEYTYYGTWAVALAGHEIAGVRRIWFDTHLVYDLSGAGPVTPFDFGSNGGDISERIAIYLGTEDQMPDPRMQAYIDAKHGEGSCPAYRGTAYIMFKDIPLEKVGNRIPTVSVEMVSTIEDHYPFETFDTLDNNLSRLWGAAFSPDYSRFMWASTHYEIWDVAARARMIGGTPPVGIGFQGPVGLYNNGDWIAAAGSGGVQKFAPDGLSAATFYTPGGVSGHVSGVRVLADGYGNEHWIGMSLVNQTTFVVGGTMFDMATLTGINAPVSSALTDSEGSIWVGGGQNGALATQAVFYRIVSGPSASGSGVAVVTGLPAGSPLDGVVNPINALHTTANGTDQFVFTYDGDLYAADRATGTIVASNLSVTVDPYNGDNQVAACPPGSSTLWLGAMEISLSDLSTVRSVSFGDWTAEAADGVIYDPVNHALITAPTTGQKITWRYLDRMGAPGVALGDILADVANDCGIADHDFSALDQVINGWSATRGQASNMVEPLLDAYDSDIRLHDWTVQGVKRTGVPTGATLPTAMFVGDPRYSVKVRQASELPRAITVDFADIDGDQQPNSKRAARPLDATDARGEQKLDLTTLALNVDDAAQLAERYFRRLWNERKQPALSLTAQNLGLEPGDVRTLELDGTTVIARATRVLIKADDIIETEWRLDHPSLATLDGSAGAAFDGRDPSVVAVPLISKGFALDIPLLTDADDGASPLLYIAAGPYADGSWPGAVVLQRTGGEYSDELTSVPSSSPVTWGYVADELPWANPNLWDRGTELTVTLQTGELIGCTEEAANADPSLNLVAIGNLGRWELLQFTNAELVTGKTYLVSGLRRGRRGTEWAAELHAAGDQFVLLDTAEPEALGLSDVGTEQSFVAITVGRTSGFPVTLTDFDGNSLRPYAPCHLIATKDAATGDWTFTWVRRTRVGGAWTSATPIALGEASEEYHLTVGDGVVSAVKTLTSPTYVWDVATQTADTGAEVMAGDLAWSIAQVSAAVGNGFIAEAVG